MVELADYRGELEEVYGLWLGISERVPYTEKLDLAGFGSAFLESALTENLCILAREGGALEGAALVHLYPGWGAVLQLWVPHDRLGCEASVKLLEWAIDLCRERKMQKISPKPLLGCPAYNEFFLDNGFTVNEEYPEGLWMRKSLKEVREFMMPEGVAITFTEDLEGSGFIGALAGLEADIALEQHGLELKPEENVLALKKEMKEEDVVYGIAQMDSAVAGYSRTVFADLLSGGSIAKNRGLAVRKDCRNRGIGEALLLSSLETARDRGHAEMFISTHSRNPARRLYEKVGFRVIETVPSLILRLD